MSHLSAQNPNLPLPGQQQSATPVFTIGGQQPGERLGSSVGLSRIGRHYSGRYVIGAPGWDRGSWTDAGRVLAGDTINPSRSLTNIVTGPGAQAFVGGSVSVITDFDRSQAGFVGAAGNGNNIKTIGDMNGDGFDDVLVASGTGSILSGRDGDNLNLIRQLDPLKIGGGFGTLLRGAGDSPGDLTGDGVPEILLGDSQFGAGGRVWLIDGANQQLLCRMDGPPNSRFGWVVCGAGDYNGDGTPDIAVGSPGQPGATDNSTFGAVWIFSGTSRGVGQAMRVILGPPAAEFGYALSPCGDANDDGFDDLLVGGPNAQAQAAESSPGHVWYLLGSTRRNVQHCAITGLGRKPLLTGSQAGMRFGHALAGGKDYDGDGDLEFMVGSPGWDRSATEPDFGRAVYWEFERTESQASWTRWGRSCPTAGGKTPRADLSARPALGSRVEIQLTGAPPNRAVGICVASEFKRTPLDSVGLPGCDAYLGPLFGIRYMQASPSGRASLAVDIPNLPALQGQQFVYQWLVFAPAANSFGAVTSNAIVGNIGR